ncbi:zinc finger protein 394-like [Labrus mixtus]|uniref:zinc finger protein 394-like n=1 Tax=Labrus mixtus TaxID=508554 RepID=UPI0029C09777|nr:zinc finger protein 394-like [Labrus mixtus]
MLKELFGKWIQPKGKSIQEVSEITILQQYLRMLSPELQVSIKEHDTDSATGATKLADVFVAARKNGQPWSYNAWRMTKDSHKPAQQFQHGEASSAGVPVTGYQEPQDYTICSSNG